MQPQHACGPKRARDMPQHRHAGHCAQAERGAFAEQNVFALQQRITTTSGSPRRFALALPT